MLRSEPTTIPRQISAAVLSALFVLAALALLAFYAGWQVALTLLLVGLAVGGLLGWTAGSVRRLARAFGGGPAALIRAAVVSVVVIAAALGLAWRD